MKVAVAAAAAALVAPGTASAAQTWKIVSHIAGSAYEETCTLDMSDGRIDGQCVAREAPAPLETHGTYAVVDGITHAEFGYDVTINDQPVHVVFKGDKQRDGEFKGAVEAAGAVGDFTAAQEF
jgi:hypothetical protein